MPLYRFICEICDDSFDEILKFDEHPDGCPNCGSNDTDKIKKQISTPALRLEGGRESMSVRHTTSEYFGPEGHMGKEEYFPEERKAKAEEKIKKEQSKGATVIMNNVPKKTKKKS